MRVSTYPKKSRSIGHFLKALLAVRLRIDKKNEFNSR
jgi:hypothetical protein